jgi:hypothetical protein
MSLLTELFGVDVLDKSLDEVKELINQLPTDRRERKAYLLKDYASIKGLKLSQKDYDEVGVGLFK